MGIWDKSEIPYHELHLTIIETQTCSIGVRTFYHAWCPRVPPNRADRQIVLFPILAKP